jgi:hypothetical protein
MPTGARAGKYSKHIDKLCCRCGLEENETHLFFTCNFARAAWFCEPWYIKTDMLIADTTSLSHLISKMLCMNHPYATIENILTFMWCIWKARNDYLFNRKLCHPNQIYHMANAINQNLEKFDVFQVQESRLQVLEANENNKVAKQGEVIKSDLQVQGSKIFSDAAWKTKKNLSSKEKETTGLGVYCQIQQDNLKATVLLQATAGRTPSPLHAEALGLLLAAKIAQIMQVNQITFLTDNLMLAKAAAASSYSDK